MSVNRSKKRSIVYYTGFSSEQWSPDSLKTGVGGSQTAIIYLSKLWQKMGFDVTVYSNIGESEGIYEGVTYIDYHRFDPTIKIDILILWREPSFLDMNVTASRVFLDLHDYLIPEEFSASRVKLVDKVFTKSVFQRNSIPSIPNSKLVIIPNGVDDSLYKDKVYEKDFYKLIYASSHYRGLEYMLRYGWPLIKKSVPQATLDIYYGWNLFDIVYSNDKEKQLWKSKMSGLMSQEGITDYGRVGQEALIDAHLRANILYYGCTFPEIDCITVRQSALAGCIPFTTAYGALGEREYCVRVPGDAFEGSTQERLAKLIIYALKNSQLPREFGGTALDEIRKGFVRIATKETWRNIAEQWVPYLTS